MNESPRWTVTFWSVAVLILLGAPATGALGDDSTSARRTEMIRRIDALIEERWQSAGVHPAPAADDATFLRRVYLDLAGRTPPPAVVRTFVQDPDPQKRLRLVNQILESPAHATHMANTWRNAMLPGGVNADQVQNIAGVQNWLREQFVENLRYDRLVSDLLVTTGGGESGPALYFTSLELDPAKMAASTARIFLGLQIECAECHDHPDDRWTQEDFWAYAAFFARLRSASEIPFGTELVDVQTGEVMLPDTEDVVPPRFPGVDDAAPDGRGTRRVQLAIWMASRENPYLADAAVNRVWAHLFGWGLVEPVDDLKPSNPPSHPELMRELAQYFRETGYDVRELLRTLTATRAYQLSSLNQDEAGDPRLLASMPIKPLTAEQIYDSLLPIMGGTGEDRLGSPFAALGFRPEKVTFLTKMPPPARTGIEFRAGIPQALTLMNGGEMARATDLSESSLLRSLQAPFFSEEDRLDILFLATLSRYPRDEERELFGAYLREAPEGPESARADVLWALLNSAEFAVNH